MIVKTSGLSGVALDWAVSLCEGYTPHDDYGTPKLVTPGGSGVMLDALRRPCYYHMRHYSTDWSQGGPIIARMGMSLKQDQPPGYPPYGWSAWCHIRKSTYHGEGQTPLIAAMRCYVASKLGDEVDVPEELV